MVSAVFLLLVLLSGSALGEGKKRDYRVHQYHFEEISIARASPDEPKAEAFSLARATSYLEAGSQGLGEGPWLRLVSHHRLVRDPSAPTQLLSRSAGPAVPCFP